LYGIQKKVMAYTDGPVHGGKLMKYIKRLAVTELEVPFEDKIKLMFLVHFGFKGNLSEFKQKLDCKKCLDNQREGCRFNNLPVDLIIGCLKRQAWESLYTTYCPEKEDCNVVNHAYLIERQKYIQERLVATRNAYEGHSNALEDPGKREQEKAERLREEEELLRLIDVHFDLTKYGAEQIGNTLVVDYCKTVEKLSCKGCCRLKDMTCTGKNLRGRTVIGCLKQTKHE
jgi:hypothetical protein